MSTQQPKPTDEMRISSAEFDRLMRGALQVSPEEASKPGKAGVTKAAPAAPKAKPKAARKPG